MPSNSGRVRNQLIGMPVACAVAAAIAWPVSWAAAVHTNWATGASFADFWMGALAILSGIGAVALTCGAVGSALDSVHKALFD